LTVTAQSVKSIYSIRSEFNDLSEEYNQILEPYDSLLYLRSSLSNHIESETSIYISCPTAFSDKLAFLEKKGDRKERAAITEYLEKEFEKDRLENQLIIKIRNFNIWNSVAYQNAKQSYDKFIRPEIEQQQIVKQELLNYIRKIDQLQEEAYVYLEKYDSCKIDSENTGNCEELMGAYLKVNKLSEAYMDKYNEVLADKEGLNTLKKEGFIRYKASYEDYYTDYLNQKAILNSKNLIIYTQLDSLRTELKILEPQVKLLVSNALENDIKAILKNEIAQLNRIDEQITSEFGNTNFFNELKELQRVSQIMIATLNPEINFDLIIEQIHINHESSIIRNSDGERALTLAKRYSTVLEDLKNAIASYDAIPYFCLNAYPQYSTEVVNENLEIINNKLDLNNENLEIRTEKFLEVSELDLSNTEFSLELLFKGHENLEKLNLSNTHISSLKYLSETNIRWLDLSNTEIDRSDLEYLKYMDNIEYLNLSNTGVKKKDIYDLCYHLKVKRKNCIAR
jgi:hypothetical protein